MGLKMGMKAMILALTCAGSMSATAGLAADKAVVQGRVASSQVVSFDVYLPLEHRAELSQLIADQQDTTSPNYHKWLTPTEFSSRFGANKARMTAVQQELAAYGLTTQVSSQKIHVTGNAGAVEQLFLTPLHAGRFANGRTTVMAPQGISLPSAMASSNAVVGGLSGFIRMRAHSHKLNKLPANRYADVGPYWFDDLKQAYSFPSYKVYKGTGVTIGILMSGAFKRADMNAYFSHELLATPNMSTVTIAGGAPFDPDGSTETHLDMQQSGGMAPGANIVLYNVPDLGDSNLLSALVTMVETNAVDVVNMSFGGAEDFYTAAYNGGQDLTGILAVYDDLFAQGNAQGITFIASSGDQGALSLPPVACLEPGATSDCGSYLQAVEFPASSPHVTGVGGTNLVTTSSPTSLNSKYISENAHSDPVTQDLFIGTPATGNIWGSGGGNSIYFKKPDYQKLVTTGSKFRTVPDLALHMGGCPQGAVLPCGLDRSSDVVAIGGGLFGVIGTSASAPDFAGLTALKIERLGTRLGNENFDIYSLAANQAAGSGLTVYRNNIPGDNGVFNSKKGYNRVIGNGSVIGVNFLLAPTVQAAGTPQTPTNP